MNIGIVLQNNFPSDRAIRKEKIATSIGASDHRPVVFARNTNRDPAQFSVDQELRPKEENLEYATIRRFSWGAGTPLFRVLTLPVPINLFWILWLIIQFKRYNIQITIVSGLRAGLPTIVAARLTGIPVILDLAENFTELAKIISKNSFTDYLTLNPVLTRLMESTTIHLSDEVWVVVEERRQQLVNNGVPESKITVISNTPTIQPKLSNTNSLSNSELKFDPPAFRLIYVGVINEFRGLDLILEALAHIDRTSTEDVHLIIAGEGPHLNRLKNLCRRLEIEEIVTFLGWIDSDSVPNLLEAGDIGIIPHQVNDFTNTTIPNKVFDYMFAKLPVLATDMDPISRIIRECDCGVVVPRGSSPEDVADIILSMKRSPRLEVMGRNGYQAVLDSYNWQREEKRIMESIQELG